MLERMQSTDVEQEPTVICSKNKLYNLISYAYRRKVQEEREKIFLTEAKDSLNNALQREIKLKLELAEIKEEKAELRMTINKLETRLSNLENSSNVSKKTDENKLLLEQVEKLAAISNLLCVTMDKLQCRVEEHEKKLRNQQNTLTTALRDETWSVITKKNISNKQIRRTNEKEKTITTPLRNAIPRRIVTAIILCTKKGRYNASL